MTNYNDGNWHKMNGKKPESVHCLSEVEMKWILLDTGKIEESNRIAKHFAWGDCGEVFGIAFRVIKEHKEPREFWAVNMTCWKGVPDGTRQWVEVEPGTRNATLFREVIE